jgi:guanylate kinase
MFVLCAPSGAGKSTLVSMLLKEFDTFSFSVSFTTRPPRKGEVNGREYHFVSREDFLQLVKENFFAEWAEVYSNLYGTPRQAALETLEGGRDMLFDIDVQGARQLRQNLQVGVYVFILPPSLEVLEERLRSRGTDDPETIARRLDAAREEIDSAREFDYWLVNDDLDLAYDRLRALYVAEKCRPSCHPGLLQEVLGARSRTMKHDDQEGSR